MAFDRSDPADLLALKNEVNNDPIAMGYSPAGSTQQILFLLNDSDNNVGGETAARIFDAMALLDALDPTDFGAPQTVAGTDSYTIALVNASVQGLDISGLKTKWRDEFAVNSATVTALDAQTSPLSRAEVLFGQFTVISREDWLAARDS